MSLRCTPRHRRYIDRKRITQHMSVETYTLLVVAMYPNVLFRTTPQDYFARLPELRVVEYTPVAVRVYGDFAIQAGTYTFAFQGADGATVEKRARFSFTFRRDVPGAPQPWTIVEHHSSSMPTAPAGLKRVRETYRPIRFCFFTHAVV